MNPAKKLLISLFTLLLLQICVSTDSIHIDQSIADGHGDVLVSGGGKFALGFFSPGNSSFRFIGIWYYKVPVQTVVWVANRDNPIKDNTSGVLSLSKEGNLVLHDRNQSVLFWSTNVTVSSSTGNSMGQLLDSGNLVLIKQDSKMVLWNSFDYPAHTMLPFTKLGLDRKTGHKWMLTSWKSPDNPGTGDWSYWLDPNGDPQLVINKGQVRRWRAGPWDGHTWNGMPELASDIIGRGRLVYSNNETSASWGLRNASIISILFLDSSGFVKRSTWHDEGHQWVEFWNVPKEPCDYYRHCGTYGNCDPYKAEQFECTCLPGFEPKSPSEWNLRDATGGCVRKQGASVCGNGEGFVKVPNAKIPDTSMAVVDLSLDLKACKEECSKNCSCTAYTISDVTKGSGCITWHGDLNDTRVYTKGGQDLYIRVDAAELAKYMKSKNFFVKKGMVAVMVASLAVISVLVISFVYWMVKRKRNGRAGKPVSLINVTPDLKCFEDRPDEEFDESRNPNLPYFDVNTIIAATDNFCFTNKLGQGGFGSVYKGRLANGQEIAVKRLSKTSRQGIEEFKNEVKLISKLQHKNLVRLFGCTIHKEEKMLIYEYLPNKSLDFFIFDKTRRSLLDWKKRFEIILGIARGLLYLHQDSRLKIIHRDLKAGNILLDAAMNPKISDFGMARIFGEDQTEANTRRVVGTYGYMSPEYAMNGLYSIKSDVFSYGILVLEIISGRKNIDYYDESPSANLTALAWDLWSEGKALEMVDSSMEEAYPIHEVLRCIQIGLLCVQECPANRPTISATITMLGNETTLPSPKKPAFVFKGKYTDSDTSTSKAGPPSNDITISELEGR